MKLTAKQIYELLVSDKFVGAVRDAGEYTDKTGYEAGFLVGKTNELVIGKVVQGNTHQTDLHDSLYSPLTPVFLVYHFHPEDTDALIPSEADLHPITYTRARRLVGIGQIFDNQDIATLLIQNKIMIGKYGEQEINDAMDNLEAPTNEDIARTLEDSGLVNAAVLNYRYNERTDKYVPKFKIRDISRFAID